MADGQQFDVDGARKAGYSDDQILMHLRGQVGTSFDVDGALKAGYSKSDVIGELSKISPQKASPLPAGTFQMRKGGPVVKPGMGVEQQEQGQTIVPIPGETFGDTMNRAIAAGKTMPPEQIQQNMEYAKRMAP